MPWLPMMSRRIGATTEGNICGDWGDWLCLSYPRGCGSNLSRSPGGSDWRKTLSAGGRRCSRCVRSVGWCENPDSQQRFTHCRMAGRRRPSASRLGVFCIRHGGHKKSSTLALDTVRLIRFSFPQNEKYRCNIAPFLFLTCDRSHP